MEPTPTYIHLSRDGRRRLKPEEEDALLDTTVYSVPTFVARIRKPTFLDGPLNSESGRSIRIAIFLLLILSILLTGGLLAFWAFRWTVK